MTSTNEKIPSEKSLIMLESLKKAVAATLERKRRLGQYAVIWDGNKPVKIGPMKIGDDASYSGDEHS